MKKLCTVILLMLLTACNDSLSDKTPAFQALINGDTEWVPVDYSASVENDGLIIFGINQHGSISINISNPEIGEFDLYGIINHSAIFQDDQFQYSTENNFVGSIGFHRQGKVIINEFNTENNYISGYFYFDAFDFSGQNTINISDGIFYRIPISSFN